NARVCVDRYVHFLDKCSTISVHVDYDSMWKCKLRRHHSLNERNVVGEAGFQYLAKSRNTFRQKHVVDAVLQICMFAADMKLPERILRDTWKTQQRLVKWSVLASCL